MIKNILIRRKESDIYLTTLRRHRWSLQVTMKVDKMCSFQPMLWPSSAEEEDCSDRNNCLLLQNYTLTNVRFIIGSVFTTYITKF